MLQSDNHIFMILLLLSCKIPCMQPEGNLIDPCFDEESLDSIIGNDQAYDLVVQRFARGTQISRLSSCCDCNLLHLAAQQAPKNLHALLIYLKNTRSEKDFLDAINGMCITPTLLD